MKSLFLALAFLLLPTMAHSQPTDSQLGIELTDLSDVDIDDPLASGDHLVYDGTEWKNSATAGTGDEIRVEDGENLGTFTTIDTTASFEDQGDLNFAHTDGGAGGPDAITATIIDDKVLESHLKVVDTAVDEECLTFEATTGDFEWQSCSGTNALLDGSSHTDTAAATVTRGDIIVGNVTPAWGELAIGTANQVLHSDGTDATWASLVDADVPDSITIDLATLATTATTANNLAADGLDAMSEIAAGIKRGPDATDTHLLTTDVAAPGTLTCLEMDTDGSIVLAAGACTTGSGGEWTDTGTILHPNESTVDEVAIGGTTEAGADTFLGVDGAAVFNEQGGTTGDFRIETTTDPDMVFVDYSANTIIFGSQTDLASKIAIDGDADEIQLLIQGNGTQTSDVLVVENSAGTDLLSIANGGTITGAGITSGANPGHTHTTSSISGILAADMGDSDHGDFTYVSNVATLDIDVVAPAEMADADHGDFTYATGVATLDIDVVAAAEMADADHGDISWSAGVASVDANAVALTTDTTGNYLASCTDGLAIDGCVASEGGTPTLAFDPTELLGSRTFGDASTDTIVWTFDRATGTDPTMTFNSGSVDFQALTEAGVAVINRQEIDSEAELIAILDDVDTGLDNLFGDNEAAGGFALDAGSEQTECVTLNAKALDCFGTAGCTLAATDGTNFSYTNANFATGADDSGSWSFGLPDNLTGTTATVEISWTSNNAACNNGADDDVCWLIDGDSYIDNDAWNGGTLGATAAAVTDRCLANGDLMVATIASYTHSYAAGGDAVLVITRDTDESDAGCAAGSDDYAQNAELLRVKVCYETDNVFSGE